jgi:DNA-binding cell septation regulator SpoVG
MSKNRIIRLPLLVTVAEPEYSDTQWLFTKLKGFFQVTVSALNFKSFDRGAMRGFFDLRYHGLTIKGCRLMSSNNGLWVALPQKEAEQDGERKYFDQMFLTPPEADHVRKIVIADLMSQGHIERPAAKQRSAGNPSTRGSHRTPEGEDVSDYYTPPGTDDGIPF